MAVALSDRAVSPDDERRPCGCRRDGKDFCGEFFRLVRRQRAAHQAHQAGVLTADDWQWFWREMMAHVAGQE